jgi:hypothetical protein
VHRRQPLPRPPLDFASASASPAAAAALKGRVPQPAAAPSRLAQSAAAAAARGGRAPQPAVARLLTPETAGRRCPCRISRRRTGVRGQQRRWWALESPPSRPLGCSPSWRLTPSWSWRPPSTRSVTAAMQLGPGMPAAKRRRTPSAMPRARVTEVFAAPGSKPSIRRIAPVASRHGLDQNQSNLIPDCYELRCEGK